MTRRTALKVVKYFFTFRSSKEERDDAPSPYRWGTVRKALRLFNQERRRRND